MEELTSFRNPALLALLVLPAALLMWTWRRRGRAVALPFDHADPPSGRLLGTLLRCAESLPALLVALAILLLAGPQSFGEPKSKRALTNIQFCVDVSGSMAADFGEGDRYEGSMKAISDFIKRRTGDAFGLTFFGNNVLHWVPLTSDISSFECALPFMRPQNVPYWFNGTEIGKALRECKKVLVERQEGERMILLVSDGTSFDLFGGVDEEIARELKSEDITVFAIHIAETEVPGEVERIAVLTGGAVFTPDDEAGLASIFERIDAMQRARFDKSLPEARDHFWPWCLAALGVLSLFLSSLFVLRATPW